MIHLDEEKLLDLAEAVSLGVLLTEEEDACLQHLEECEACRERFRTAMLLTEMETDEGKRFLAGVLAHEEESRLVAALRVVRKRLDEGVSVIMEQIEAFESAFRLRQPLAAARGGAGDVRGTVKLVKEADEKTFALYDPAGHELLVQISEDLGDVRVRVFFDDGGSLEAAAEKRGNVWMALIRDIPDKDFEVRIER